MKLKKIHIQFKKPTVGQWIWCGFCVLLIAFLTYIVIRLIPKDEEDGTQFVYYEYKEPAEDMPQPDYSLDNDKLHFVLDPSTTHFEVVQKDTGKVWYSNPKNAKDDSIALPKEMSYMDSTLLLTYSTENGVENTYDTSSFSVQKKFYDVTNNGDCIEVNYIVGDIERTYIVPMALTEERMDTFTEQMSSGNRNIVLQYYRKYDIDKLTATDNESDLLAKYPVLTEDNVYVFRDQVPLYMKERIESIFNAIGYTYSDFEEDLKMYSGSAIKNTPMFNVSIIYKLDGDQLIVEVPFEKISFKKDFPLVTLSVLPYFGAGSIDDKGYLFVPEGGGAIINFNNGKTKQNNYYADVYGWDYCKDREAIVNETKINFPVFGIAYENSSFITIIDKGASYAGIFADISGRYNSYNNVYASYTLAHEEEYDVSTKSNNAEFIFEESLPKDEVIIQKYRFINTGSYIDMAKAYQKHLVENENLKKQNKSTLPVSVEIVGAIDKVQQVFGFPKSLPYELTTYKQSNEIINKLSENGFDNVFIRLSGFINGGIKQTPLNKIKTVNKLGSKRDFTKLVSNQKDINYKTYLEGIVQYAKHNKLGDGFQMYRDSSRLVSSEMAKLFDYSTVWYGKDKTRQEIYYLVKPMFAKKMTENIESFTTKKGIYGVAFRDNGNELSADYDEDNHMSREKVKQLQVESFKEMNKNGTGILIRSGNDYAVGYVDCVTDMDYFGTKYLILDEYIPFYQIALHGYVNYTGKPVNLAPDANEEVLKAASYGGGLNFTFIGEKAKKLQDTNYTQYFGADFDMWYSKASDIYSRFKKELGSVYDKEIVNYVNLTSKVSCTEYEDGTTVYVNFSNETYYTEDGTSVPANDYIVKQN